MMKYLLQSVEVLFQEMENFTINVPELQLLRQYHTDAALWISRFNNILVKIHEREDQHNVVDELNCIVKDGASLRIQGSGTYIYIHSIYSIYVYVHTHILYQS